MKKVTFPEAVSLAEIGAFHVISMMTDDDWVIRRKDLSTGKIVGAGISDIAKELELSEIQTYRIVKKLKHVGMIGYKTFPKGNRMYCVNPQYLIL